MSNNDEVVKKIVIGDGSEEQHKMVHKEFIDSIKEINSDKIVCAMSVIVVKSDVEGEDGVNVSSFFSASSFEDLEAMTKILKETITAKQAARFIPDPPSEVRH